MSTAHDGDLVSDLSDAIPLARSSSLVLVANTPKGRGVFASESIPSRTVVEVSPVLVMPLAEAEQYISKTLLNHYTYTWPIPSDTTPTKYLQTQALPLGLGSMFNHSTHPKRLNVGWIRDIPGETIKYTTLRDISAGEELCISYGARLTFVDVEEQERADERLKEEEMEATHFWQLGIDAGDTEDEEREKKTTA